MSKKVVSIILIFLTAFFVFVQPLCVVAATGGDASSSYYKFPVYCQPDLYPYSDIHEDIVNNFYYIQSNHGYYSGYSLAQMHVLVFEDVRFPGLINFVYCHIDNPMCVRTYNATYDGDDMFGVSPTYDNSFICAVVGTNNGSVTACATFGYHQTDIILTPAQGVIYYTNSDLLNLDGSFVCISSQSAPDSGNDSFTGDIFEDDFSHSSSAFFESLQESMEAADQVVQNTTLETTEDTDNKFLGIFQSFSTMIGNVYSQVETVAQSITDFVDTFFNEFVPSVIQDGFRGIKAAIEAAVSSIVETVGNLTGSFLAMLQEWFDWAYTYEFVDGLSLQSIISFIMDSIKDIAELLGEIAGEGTSLLDTVLIILPDPLAVIIDQIYQSGVGTGEVFSLLTCLEYWFVPDTEVLRSRINEINESDVSVMQIKLAGENLRDDLISIEPVAPVFTMPSSTFVVPGTNGEKSYTLPEIKIGFEWFEAWKPYTDFFIAAFLYIGYFWHLFTSLPSLFSGGSATISFLPEPKDKPLDTHWSGGIYRK